MIPSSTYNLSVNEERGKIHLNIKSPDKVLDCNIRTHWWLTGKILSYFGKAVEIKYSDDKGNQHTKYINVGSLFKRVYSPKNEDFDAIYKKIRGEIKAHRIFATDEPMGVTECLEQLDKFLLKEETKVTRIWEIYKPFQSTSPIPPAFPKVIPSTTQEMPKKDLPQDFFPQHPLPPPTPPKSTPPIPPASPTVIPSTTQEMPKPKPQEIQSTFLQFTQHPIGQSPAKKQEAPSEKPFDQEKKSMAEFLGKPSIPPQSTKPPIETPPLKKDIPLEKPIPQEKKIVSPILPKEEKKVVDIHPSPSIIISSPPEKPLPEKILIPPEYKAKWDKIEDDIKKGHIPSFSIKGDFKGVNIELEGFEDSITGYTEYPNIQKSLHHFILEGINTKKINPYSAIYFFAEHKDKEGLTLLKDLKIEQKQFNPKKNYGEFNDWRNRITKLFYTNDPEILKMMDPFFPIRELLSQDVLPRLKNQSFIEMQEYFIQSKWFKPSPQEERRLHAEKEWFSGEMEKTNPIVSTYKIPDRSLNVQHKNIYGGESVQDTFRAETKKSIEFTLLAIKEERKSPDNPLYSFKDLLSILGERRKYTAEITGNLLDYYKFAEKKQRPVDTEIGGQYEAYAERIVAQQGGANTFTLDGKEYVLTKYRVRPDNSKFVEHAYADFWKEKNPLFLHVEALYKKMVLSDYASSEALGKDIARFHWLMANIMPFIRGSASMLETLTDSIWLSHGYIPSKIEQGKSLDLEALTSKLEVFEKIYPIGQKV